MQQNSNSCWISGKLIEMFGITIKWERTLWMVVNGAGVGTEKHFRHPLPYFCTFISVLQINLLLK